MNPRSIEIKQNCFYIIQICLPFCVFYALNPCVMCSNVNVFNISKDIYIFIQARIVYFLFLDAPCFPSNTKIKLENGKIVTMSQLQNGDKVQTGYKHDQEN